MDKATPIEKILKKFDNKYKALVIISLEARRLMEQALEHNIEIEENIYLKAMKNVLKGLIEWEEN